MKSPYIMYIFTMALTGVKLTPTSGLTNWFKRNSCIHGDFNDFLKIGGGEQNFLVGI
jgi:hypothetical protein